MSEIKRERVAVIRAHPRTGQTPRLTTIRAYMPANYEAVDLVHQDEPLVVILGEDSAGWTLDGYVIPRLASGIYFAEEMHGREAATLAARAQVALAGEAEQLAAERAG